MGEINNKVSPRDCADVLDDLARSNGRLSYLEKGALIELQRHARRGVPSVDKLLDLMRHASLRTEPLKEYCDSCDSYQGNACVGGRDGHQVATHQTRKDKALRRQYGEELHAFLAGEA